MTDARSDLEFDLAARQRAVAEGQRAYREARATSAPTRGRLSVEQAAARRASVRSAEMGALEVRATESVRPEPADDPSVALRNARLGGAAALVLAMLLIWIRQQGRGR